MRIFFIKLNRPVFNIFDPASSSFSFHQNKYFPFVRKVFLLAPPSSMTAAQLRWNFITADSSLVSDMTTVLSVISRRLLRKRINSRPPPLQPLPSLLNFAPSCTFITVLKCHVFVNVARSLLTLKSDHKYVLSFVLIIGQFVVWVLLSFSSVVFKRYAAAHLCAVSFEGCAANATFILLHTTEDS